MTKLLKTAALFVGAAANLLAALDGTVINKTTGNPQSGVSISLVKPGQGGMQTLGTTVSDAAGHFRFEHDQPGGGPQLLQASYKGVNYNKLMTPNLPTSGIELDIYEATGSPQVARVAEQMMLVEPSEKQVGIDYTVIVQNPSNTTYSNPNLGDFRFYLPPEARGQVQVRAQGPQGMPLPRAAEKTSDADVYKVDFPIKPGETQFDVAYALPAPSARHFEGRIVGVKGMPAGPLRLIAPSGVTIAGRDIQGVGTEPKTGATIYTVNANERFSASISGTGSLHPPEEAATDTSDQPPVTEGLPQIYRHLPWLLALAFSVLAVGLVLLFVSSPVRSPSGK